MTAPPMTLLICSVLILFSTQTYVAAVDRQKEEALSVLKSMKIKEAKVSLRTLSDSCGKSEVTWSWEGIHIETRVKGEICCHTAFKIPSCRSI